VAQRGPAGGEQKKRPGGDQEGRDAITQQGKKGVRKKGGRLIQKNLLGSSERRYLGKERVTEALLEEPDRNVKIVQRGF